MPIFAVDRDLPGITMEQLGDAQKRAIETDTGIIDQAVDGTERFKGMVGECNCLIAIIEIGAELVSVHGEDSVGDREDLQGARYGSDG